MAKRIFLTKKQPDLNARHSAEIKFKPATEMEMKALGDDLPEGYIAGWASTDDLDHYNHIVKAGAFDESIAEKKLTGPRGIKLLIQHDRDRPAGVIRVLETRGGGLWMEAELNLKIGYVRDFYEAAKMNGGLSFSVGFFLIADQFEWIENGQTEYLLIKKAELEEVSVVTFPGNAAAEMTFIKEGPDGKTPTAPSFESIADLEKALVAQGDAKSRNAAQRLTRVVKANLHLFQPTEPAPVQAKPETKDLDALGALIKQMKDALTPS